ncbi:MAG: AzlD domain-containing protein [Limnochordia bacterium]
MALVTYLPRALPLLILSDMQLPLAVLRWLSFVPVAVLAALLAPELFMSEGELLLFNPYLLAALPAFLVAARTGSLLGTALVGMLVVMVSRNFL